MAASTQSDNAWTLDRAVGELHRGGLSARVDVSRPEWGLRQVRLNGHDLPGHLLAVHRHAETGAAESAWPLPIADAYVRGDDLVASYQPIDDWPYSPQLYWGAGPLEKVDDLLGSLSLLMSVQTHLLDTWPRISVVAQIACKEVLHVLHGQDSQTDAKTLTGDGTLSASNGACCLLMRLAGLSISYAEMMPASDFRELRVSQDDEGRCRAEWELFADFLEKGVIRRARLQSVFLHRENDVQLAAACCEALEQRPLPLTT